MDTDDKQPQVSEINNLRKQAEEYLNGWKRAKADLVNLQNDMAREREQWAQFAASRTIERMLPAIDTLEAAAIHTPDLAEVIKKFVEYLKAEGVTEIPVEGKYDHAAHEVVGREKHEGVESDTIVIVAQKGYMLHDKVLRPAKVIIAE